MSHTERARCTVLYDNTTGREDMLADWGFSCCIEYGRDTIVFDSGAEGSILEKNINAICGSPERVDSLLRRSKVVLSHDHFDHSGGLSFLSKKYQPSFFVPSTISSETLQSIPRSEIILVSEKIEVASKVWSTGIISGSISEQSLVVQSEKGLVLLTGCAHPGIVSIAKAVCCEFGEPPYMILGGFHWYESSEDFVWKEIVSLQKMGVQKIAPCHCTGESAISWIRHNWPQGFVDVSAGTVLYF